VEERQENALEGCIMAKIQYLEDQHIDLKFLDGNYGTVTSDVRCTHSSAVDGQAGYTTVRGQDYYVERAALCGDWNIIEEAKGK